LSRAFGAHFLQKKLSGGLLGRPLRASGANPDPGCHDLTKKEPSFVRAYIAGQKLGAGKRLAIQKNDFLVQCQMASKSEDLFKLSLSYAF
jgi:hypothetical protein